MVYTYRGMVKLLRYIYGHGYVYVVWLYMAIVHVVMLVRHGYMASWLHIHRKHADISKCLR